MFKYFMISLLLLASPVQAGMLETLKKVYSEQSGPKDAQVVGLLVSKVMKNVSKHHRKADSCDSFEVIDYCFYEGAPNTSTIVYALHGFGHDGQFWSYNVVTKKIEEYWKKKQIERPHVVSLSLGEFWTFNKTLTNTLDSFVEYIEADIVRSPIVTRHLFGDSMGGFNAMSWFTYSQNSFQGLQLACPAFPSSLIPRDKAERFAVVEPLLRPIAELIFGIDSPAGAAFDLDKFLTRISQSNNLQKLSLVYVDPDFFGFLEGNQFLDQQFQEVLHKDQYFSETQTNTLHCIVDSDQLALDLATSYGNAP